MNLWDLGVGDRVELHPGTDAWMQGDRFARVVSVGRAKVTVVAERSGRRLRFYPRNIDRLAPAGNPGGDA